MARHERQTAKEAEDIDECECNSKEAQKNPCGQMQPKSSWPYVCTRKKGHTGQHKACDPVQHDIARWKNHAEKKKRRQ